MEKYPNEENLRDNAWATALDENLRRAVRRSGKELLLIRHEPRFDIAKAALYVIGATMSIPIPIAVPSIYATDTIMAYREAKKMGMGLKDLQFSLFPPICMHPDRYLALLAMTSDATPLIEYRKK
jgi:hypothetical protein